MDAKRIRAWFEEDGGQVVESGEQCQYYIGCALKLEEFLKEESNQLAYFAIMQIISINELTFPDGFIVNYDNLIGYDLSFEEISVILYSICGNVFFSQKDLIRSYRSHSLVDEEYLVERRKVELLLFEAGVTTYGGEYGYLLGE
jgi:hypothetical protein